MDEAYLHVSALADNVRENAIDARVVGVELLTIVFSNERFACGLRKILAVGQSQPLVASSINRIFDNICRKLGGSADARVHDLTRHKPLSAS
jgi:hypothetical protein